ncbi:hypothetical protein CPBF367_20780 [Xanthomonas arboricola pv. juglandis]|nr:hypothetical protein CPBF367_20780 [Xanthomonas arboricola pv. juglandis]
MAIGPARVARCCAAQHGYCPPLRSGVQACMGNSACVWRWMRRGCFGMLGELRWRPDRRQRCSGRRGRLIGVASRDDWSVARLGVPSSGATRHLLPGGEGKHRRASFFRPAPFSRPEKGSTGTHPSPDRHRYPGRRRDALALVFLPRPGKNSSLLVRDAGSGRSTHRVDQHCAAGSSQASMICRICGNASRKCCTRRGSSCLPAMLSSLRMASSTVHGAL